MNFINDPAIIITVYDRFEHIKNCLESLERCEGASNFHVIVGSDAPFKSEHQKNINLVKKYLYKKKNDHGFKKISILDHSENIGEIKNAEKCHNFAQQNNHDCFIFMEDDVVVGRYFLKFMADALKSYSDNSDIIAINGYIDHDIQKKTKKPFLFNRFSAYGFGSWYKKWNYWQEKRESINYPKKMIKNLKNFKKVASFTSYAKSYPFLAERFYWAGDIEIGHMMEFEGLWVLKPPVSLTANRGMDGSGKRSGVNYALQSMEASDDYIDIPAVEDLERVLFQQVKPKIRFVDTLVNWFCYFTYNYIPFGFVLLKKLRSIKKSL